MRLSKSGFIKFLLLIFFLGLVIGWLGFGERGFIHLYKMEKEREVYLDRIGKLEQANQSLLEEIKRLRTDNDYIESLARRELGLIKEDEILYRFDREKEEPPSSQRLGPRNNYN